MINVDELLYEFELKINKIAREDNQNIPLEDKLIFLNQAQITWVKSKINQNNIYKIGYEGFRKRIDDLQVLKINDYKLNVTKTDNKRYISYRSVLDSIPEYMFYVNSYAVASYKKCSSDTIGIDLIKEGELNTLYFNEYYKPSFKWRTTLATIGNNNLYTYTDGDFDIKDVYLTYLRYPKEIDSEGYVKLDGITNSTNQDSELPEYAKNDIVDLAVKYAAQSTDNIFQSQVAKEREINNE